MTPAARVQTAIELLDDILAGTPAEKALTGWARRSRFAGSKDRASVRDHVFTALRCFRSHAVLVGGVPGRGLILGGLREAGVDPSDMFTGEGYAPAPLSAEEQAEPVGFSNPAEEFDIPDWLWSSFSSSLGDNAEAAAQALRQRAPVHLRVNLRKASVAEARAALEGEESEIRETAEAKTAQQAAAELGVERDQIAKSIIFQGQNSGEALLFIAAGGNQVCPTKAATLAREPLLHQRRKS